MNTLQIPQRRLDAEVGKPARRDAFILTLILSIDTLYFRPDSYIALILKMESI